VRRAVRTLARVERTISPQSEQGVGKPAASVSYAGSDVATAGDGVPGVADGAAAGAADGAVEPCAYGGHEVMGGGNEFGKYGLGCCAPYACKRDTGGMLPMTAGRSGSDTACAPGGRGGLASTAVPASCGTGAW
jgi:hypothetical protein